MALPNPFFHRGPVRDAAYFFGRKREIGFLTGLLEQRQSVAVSGPRRIGKTSLLFQLCQPETAPPGLRPTSTRWAYLDGGALDGFDEEWFYGAVDRALGGEVDAVPYTRFVERLRSLAAQNARLILALDEFELVAANPRLGPSLFNHLRGLAAQFPLQFVTASKDPLLQLTFAHRDTLSSPFFNIFAPLHLPLFTADEATDLLATLSARAGCAFAPDTIDFLLRLAGPHPLFLQVAGYRAFPQAGQAGALPRDAEAGVRAQVLADLEQHLAYYWNSLDSEARYTLAALPLLERSARSAALERLNAAGLLRETSGVSKTVDVSYLGAAVEDFVRRQAVEGLLQGGPFLLDTRRGLAAARGRRLHLTPTEFAALRLFLERPGQMLTPEAIESALWPGESSPDAERARGAVKKLRAALGDAGGAIVNRRGQGWLLVAED